MLVSVDGLWCVLAWWRNPNHYAGQTISRNIQGVWTVWLWNRTPTPRAGEIRMLDNAHLQYSYARRSCKVRIINWLFGLHTHFGLRCDATLQPNETRIKNCVCSQNKSTPSGVFLFCFWIARLVRRGLRKAQLFQHYATITKEALTVIWGKSGLKKRLPLLRKSLAATSILFIQVLIQI